MVRLLYIQALTIMQNMLISNIKITLQIDRHNTIISSSLCQFTQIETKTEAHKWSLSTSTQTWLLYPLRMRARGKWTKITISCFLSLTLRKQRSISRNGVEIVPSIPALSGQPVAVWSRSTGAKRPIFPSYCSQLQPGAINVTKTSERNETCGALVNYTNIMVCEGDGWREMCDGDFSKLDAQVICWQLGNSTVGKLVYALQVGYGWMPTIRGW